MDKVYRPWRDGPKNSMKPSAAKPMAKPMKPTMAKPGMPVRTDKVYRPSVDGPKNPMMNPKMGAVRRMRGMK
jgi:hypothetical protein